MDLAYGTQQSRVRVVEMSYLRGACVVTRWAGESDENMYERCCVRTHANGVMCGVVDWVKINILRWFEHIQRMKSEEFVKKVYVSETVGPNSKGRPLGRWKDRVKKYMCERGATRRGEFEQAEGVFGKGDVEALLLWLPP